MKKNVKLNEADIQNSETLVDRIRTAKIIGKPMNAEQTKEWLKNLSK
jgi:hypothetical protein